MRRRPPPFGARYPELTALVVAVNVTGPGGRGHALAPLIQLAAQGVEGITDEVLTVEASAGGELVRTASTVLAGRDADDAILLDLIATATRSLRRAGA